MYHTMQNFDRRNIDELDKYLVIYQNFTIHKFSPGADCIYPIQQNSNFPDPTYMVMHRHVVSKYA